MKPIPGAMTAASIATFLALSGCAADVGTSAPQAIPDFSVEEYGAIHGLLVDDSLFPVSGAEVVLESFGLVVTTNSDGVFVFPKAPVGEQLLIVQVAGYESVSIKVLVVAGETAHIDVHVARIASADAYHVAKIGRGIFGCGATYRQGVTTVNGAFFGISGCGSLASAGLDNFTWRTRLSDSITLWRGAAFETEWKSTQALGHGMVQDWAVEGCANNRNATFTRDTGPSPLHQVMNAFQLDYRISDLENSSCNGDDRCNLKGCQIMNRMFSWPATTGSTAPIDVGVTIQQAFTTYLTEFYRVEPPPNFSALPDG